MTEVFKSESAEEPSKTHKKRAARLGRLLSRAERKELYPHIVTTTLIRGRGLYSAHQAEKFRMDLGKNPRLPVEFAQTSNWQAWKVMDLLDAEFNIMRENPLVFSSAASLAWPTAEIIAQYLGVTPRSDPCLDNYQYTPDKFKQFLNLMHPEGELVLVTDKPAFEQIEKLAKDGKVINQLDSLTDLGFGPVTFSRFELPYLSSAPPEVED